MLSVMWSIAGHVFKYMPVYERGGKSIECLNIAYNNVFSMDERVGINTFTDIIKLLTKRGESKAGLSTYYIQLRSCSYIFIKMIKRVIDLPYVDVATARSVKVEATALLSEWDQIQQFVMWEYSNRHLQIEDQDICHCCSHALNNCCTHGHKQESCAKCNNCFTFFDLQVRSFLSQVQEQEVEDRQEAAG